MLPMNTLMKVKSQYSKINVLLLPLEQFLNIYQNMYEQMNNK